MGKGDKKTKKGKIFKGSFGNSRRKGNVSQETNAVVAEPKQEAKPKAKPAAKKAAK